MICSRNPRRSLPLMSLRHRRFTPFHGKRSRRRARIHVHVRHTHTRARARACAATRHAHSRDRASATRVRVRTYTRTHTYIYIYIYIHAPNTRLCERRSKNHVRHVRTRPAAGRTINNVAASSDKGDAPRRRRSERMEQINMAAPRVSGSFGPPRSRYAH